MRAFAVLGFIGLSLAISGEAQAMCETLPSPLHGEVQVKGVRYAASAGGLLIEDKRHGQSVVLSACEGLAGTYVQAIALDTSGLLTLAIRGKGLWTFDPQSRTHERLVDDARLSWPTALVWLRGALWVGTVQNGLWRIDFKDGAPKITQPIWRFRSKRVSALALDKEGALLVGRDLGGLWRVDARARSKRLLRGSVQGIERLGDAIIVNQGASRCQLTSGRRCRRVKGGPFEESTRTTLKSAHITSLALHPGPEGQERLWVGTFDAGVMWRDSEGDWHAPEASGEAPRLVNMLQSEGDRLWAATPTGAFVMAGGHWRRFGEQSGLASDHVNALHINEGQVWFATSHGLSRWDGQVMKTWNVDDGLPYRIVYSVAVHEGRVLAGTAHGLGVFEAGKWTQHRMGGEGLSDEWINAVAFRADGSALAGTYDAGVDRLYEGGVKAVKGLDKVWVNPSGLFPVPSLGGVFVATLGNGLWFWPDDASPVKLRQGRDLPSQDVTSLQRWGDTLWIGTRNGLARWSLADLGLH